MPRRDSATATVTQESAENGFPLTARVTLPAEMLIPDRMTRGSVISVVSPAMARLSAVATRRLSRLSMQRVLLGTARPARLLAGVDPSHRYLFLMPTTEDDPLGIDIRYIRDRPYINLQKVLEPLGRTVPEGFREYYRLEFTRMSVGLGEWEGRALYTELVPIETAPVRVPHKASKVSRSAARPRREETARRRSL